MQLAIYSETCVISLPEFIRTYRIIVWILSTVEYNTAQLGALYWMNAAFNGAFNKISVIHVYGSDGIKYLIQKCCNITEILLKVVLNAITLKYK